MADRPFAPPKPAADYVPSERDQTIIRAVEDKYDRYARARRPHEQTWYLNASFFRGNQYVYWHQYDNRLVAPPAPKHRIRLPINKIFSKVRARHSKFLKNRPVPVVLPATSELRDRQNARATTKALDYAWRKIHLEARYREALANSAVMGHGYWWFHWNPMVLGRVKLEDPEMGQTSIVDVPLGEVEVEVGTPFEVLVADPGIAAIGQQSEILRVKLRQVAEVRARYPEAGKYVMAEAHDDPALRYERQIATLNPQSVGTFSTQLDARTTPEGEPEWVVVKEWFERPTAPYPKGRYAVVANGVLLRYVEELPYGFGGMDNPYPLVDFPDLLQAGQYWNTTVIEQLVPLQREYNLLRSKIAEQLRVMAHPKLLVAKQHQLAEGTWSSEAGELVEYVALPGIPPPQAWVPPNIASDAWQSLQFLAQEFDDISHIYPESEGRVGQATSGFQTNLIQEATDAVHAPDIRAHELAVEEAAWKIRRLMKLYYSVPRLLTVTGRDLQPEVLEFSSDQIDEHADIVVQAGSGLPQFKGARIQSIMELYNMGLLGDQNDPEVKRRAMAMLELTTLDDAYDYARRDEDQARIENDKAVAGELAHQPDAWENHELHYRVHTDLLKSAESEAWPPEQRLGFIRHLIQHVKFQNPQSAVDLASRYGVMDVVQDILPQMMGQPGMPGMPGAPPGGPPALPPAPPPEAALSGATQAVTAEEGGGFGARGSEQYMPAGV